MRTIFKQKPIQKMQSFDDDEFIRHLQYKTGNKIKGRHRLRHVDSSKCSTFYPTPSSAQRRWTKDHPVEQVIVNNPSDISENQTQLKQWRDVKNFHHFRSIRCMGISRQTPLSKKVINLKCSGKTNVNEKILSFATNPRLVAKCNVNQPDGFVDPYHPDKVYRLKKALRWSQTSTKSVCRYQAKPTEKHLTAVSGSFGTLKIPLTWDSGQLGTSKKQTDALQCLHQKAEYFLYLRAERTRSMERTQHTDYGLSTLIKTYYCDSKIIHSLLRAIQSSIPVPTHRCSDNHFIKDRLKSVMASKPKTMKDAIEFAAELMYKKINTFAERQAKNKRKLDNNNQAQQQPPKKQGMAIAYTAGSGERKEYDRTLPLSNKCKFHHYGQCTVTCANCKRVGHLTRDCRIPAANKH
ncbi:reverse transcriptase domain-containing protein [Tanacetum coccineum]